MRKIGNIKALQSLLKAEKSYWRAGDKLQEISIFGNDVELNLDFDLSEIICEMLDYKEKEIDWAYDRIYDYVRDELTLDEITKILLED